MRSSYTGNKTDINKAIQNTAIRLIHINKDKDNEEWILSSTKKRCESLKKKIKTYNKDIIIKDDNQIKIYKIDPKSITFKNKDSSNFF